MPETMSTENILHCAKQATNKKQHIIWWVNDKLATC